MRIGTAVICALVVLASVPADGQAQKKQRDVISREELVALEKEDLDLYAAIRRLRPHFVEMPRGARTLGGGAVNPIMVVVDGRRSDGQILQTLRVAEVKEVRYLDPSRAQNEYGITANGGAIVVKRIGAPGRGGAARARPRQTVRSARLS